MTEEELLKVCDAALLRGKRDGKGGVTGARDFEAERSRHRLRSPSRLSARRCTRATGALFRCRLGARELVAGDSFGAKGTLAGRGVEYEVFRLDALQERFDVARLPFSLKVLLENLLAHGGQRLGLGADIEALAGWDAKAKPSKEIAFTPGARPDAGLHRRARRRGPRGDARRDGGDGRRSSQDQPAGAGRAGDRPLRAGRRLRHARRLPDQRRARVRAQPGALLVPALGPGGVRRLRGRAAGHGHRAPGQPRVPGARGVLDG